MKLNSKLLGGVGFALMAFAVSAPAQAQTVPLYGGGSTLSEKINRDIFNCYGNHSGGDTTVGLVGPQTNCNAVAPYRSNVEPLYAGVGSGNGKKAFINHDASQYSSGGRIPRFGSGSFDLRFRSLLWHRHRRRLDLGHDQSLPQSLVLRQ